MLTRTIIVNSIEPALLSVRSPLGVDLDLSLFFRSQASAPIDPGTLRPQLALRPRSASQVYAYDVDTVSAEAGIGEVSVPGSALQDLNGYTIELYTRREADNPVNPPVPTGLIAKGLLALDGGSYAQIGPLAAIAVPTIIGPQGPVGPVGPAGQRGSIWTTGDGDPTVIGGEIDGDMYLNNLNGDVWRFNGTSLMWTLGTF